MTKQLGPNIGSGSGAYSVGLSYRPAFRPSATSRPASAKVSVGSGAGTSRRLRRCLPFILADQAAEVCLEQAIHRGVPREHVGGEDIWAGAEDYADACAT